MHGALIVGIGMGGLILFFATIGLIIIGIIRASKSGGFSKSEKKTQAEETRMIQDIYYGLSKMEERVEALETILIERQRKDYNK
jgi:phage shock protein B